MISVIKVSDSSGLCVPSIVLPAGSVAIADAGGGGGGGMASVCMFPASAGRDSTKSRVATAQSCWSFCINVSPEKAGLMVVRNTKDCSRTQSSAVRFLSTAS